MRRFSAALLAGLLCASGCGKDEPQTPAGLKQAVCAARDEARAAEAKTDHKAADRAADRAEKYAAKVKDLAGGEGEVAAEARKLLAESDAAAREARHFAELAAEKHELGRKVGSLKARAYRGGRAVAVKGFFKALSLAADGAAKKGVDELPEKVRGAAVAAAGLAAALAGRKPLEDGSPDWAGIAADMDAFAAKPPRETAVFLTAVFFFAGRSSLALYEIEAFDRSQLVDEEERALFHVARAFVYRANGFGKLAIREIEIAAGGEGEYDPQTQSGLHLASGLLFLWEKDYRSADRELGRALKADPNNAVAIYLTGERLLASGEWEKAAECLEAEAGGGEHGWLAERVAARARQVRDAKGNAQPLVYDKKFVTSLVLEFLARAAEKSETGRKLKFWAEWARASADPLLKLVPGMGADEEKEPAEGKEEPGEESGG
ncbi:MAG: tetratricopeptide repeat protein [Planctomycetota bacterium]